MTAIPHFIAFLNGGEFKNFKGANEQALNETVMTLSNKVPKASTVSTRMHETLTFKQFKHSNMMPMTFKSVANLDKMKKLIVEFVDSDTVKDDVELEVNFFRAWAQEFKLEEITKVAVAELIALLNNAEGRPKIALIDLVRLLLTYDKPASYIVYNHWTSFEINIFQQLLCLDIEDPNNRELHNYHLISLRMAGNLYATNIGANYAMLNGPSKNILQFLKNSLSSAHSKVVFTAAIVLFNHVMLYRRDISTLTPLLKSALQAILITLGRIEADDARLALLLAEVRIIYKNKDLLRIVVNSKDDFLKVHNTLKAKTQDSKVLEAI